MNINPRPVPIFAIILALAVVVPGAAQAQTSSALAGKITGPSGAAVSGATVSVKNTATGLSSQTQTDAGGLYSMPDLAPGQYEISVSAQGYAAKTASVTFTAGAKQSLDLALAAVAGNSATPTLNDLGFTPQQSQGSAEEQARLDRRSRMLKMHQRLGLITLAPLLATLATSNGAAGRHSTASGRDLHAALGSITAGMYFTAASFAIFAPKVSGTPVRGPIRLHRALAWIHGPGMILTPILGALAYQQLSSGQRVHGIAKAHAPVAVVTSAAYGLAILSVSIKF